jgi:hypothetical protein
MAGMSRGWSAVVTCVVGLTLLVTTPDARASRAYAQVYLDEDDYFGPVSFTTAAGEKNRLTVTNGGLGVVFRDPGSHVHARGQCKRLGAHKATCPTSDDTASIALGNRGDRATIRESAADVVVHGDRGDDVLIGGGDDFGDAGDDVLRGGGTLNGGPGRDRLYGGPGSDTFVDGETDARAAPDVFRGGGPGQYGDTVDFSLRSATLRVDLARQQTSTGDTMFRIANLVSGSGDDRLTGSAGENTIDGGSGADTIRGLAGNDTLIGEAGADRVFGGTGNDVVWGNAGTDRISGGPGDDVLESNEPGEGGAAAPAAPDLLSCGAGVDHVVSESKDTVEPACEQLWAAGVALDMTPIVHDGRADFTATCAFADFNGCHDTLSLHGPTGEEWGAAPIELARDTTATISVPLSPAGAAALRAGTVLHVDVTPPPDPFLFAGGYQLPLRAG